MTSKIEICNLALSNIGQASIQDFDEASAEASACRLRYDQALDATLAGFWWGFAKKVEALALASANAPAEWEYRYQRPSDCIEARYIVDPLGRWTRRVRFEVAGQEIYTDMPEAKLAYTRRVTDPTFYPPLFVDLLARRLGADMVMTLSLDRNIRADEIQLYQRGLAIAAASSANEQDPYDLYARDASWIEGR